MKRLGFTILMLGAVCISSEAFAAKLCGCGLKKSSDRTMKNPCGDKEASACGGVCFAQDGNETDAKAGFDAADKAVADAKASGDDKAYKDAVMAQAKYMTDHKIYGKACDVFAIGQAMAPSDPLGGYVNLEEETDWDLLSEASVNEQGAMESQSNSIERLEPRYLPSLDGEMNLPTMPISNRQLR